MAGGTKETGICKGTCWRVEKQDAKEFCEAVEPGTVDLVIADPPYNQGLKYDDYEDNKKAEEFLDWCDSWMSAVKQTLKPYGSFFLFMGERFASEIDVAAKKLGFHKRTRIVWYYTFGQNNSRSLTPSHTAIFWYTNDRSKWKFSKDDPNLRVPSARQLIYGDKRANSKGKLPDNVWLLHKSQYEGLLRPDDDLWLESRVAGTFNSRSEGDPCQLPAALVQRILRMSSEEGDVVLDPFCGSGEIALNAVKLRRHALTCDISQTCISRATERLRGLK